MRMRGGRTALVAAGLLGLAAAAFSQRFGGFRGGFRGFTSDAPESEFSPNAEFHFLRLEYNDGNGNRGFGFGSRRGRASGWWGQDWPDADEHFTKGVQRLTRIDAGDPQHVSLRDEKLFDYPWIYATQTGYWQLSDEETSRLREYLLRGGFIMTDDFWDQNGPQEWDVFTEAMNRVFPGQPITDIGLDDSVMHVLYDIQQKDLVFIPGSRHLCGRGVCQPPGTKSAWRAMYDPKNRMVVSVNFDTDIGDAWEFADVPYYPEAMTTLAYRYGINYLIYSITH
ncbi:MAG TPA: DUF4159 domain-containing protein [Bryobacteraceae bacterium]|nr:DUF4159 domain-containing protein [Bryobacteraceae bacterium]